MTDSMAQPADDPPLAAFERAGWQTVLGWTAAILLGLLFILSGVWKITDPQAAAIRMSQARVPESLSLAAALGFGIAEALAGVLLIVPRYRRWGAALCSLLLIAFMVYVGLEYNTLRGADCSCFPWVKRVVGPMFFIGDAVMLVFAGLAALWALPAQGWRGALLIAGAVTVFALVSFGVGEVRQTGVRAPATVTVEGQPYSIQSGRVFLFFFHPECMRCFADAKAMSQYQWGDTRVVGVPVEMPQFAPQFLLDTGLRASITTDFNSLKQVFHYTSYPFGVVVENGRQKASITNFEDPEPGTTLKKLGLVK